MMKPTKSVTCALSEDSDKADVEDSDKADVSEIRVYTVHSKSSKGLMIASCGQLRLRSDWIDSQADLCCGCAHGLYGPQREKTCLREFSNNTGADQPAHPRSLISAFVIRFLENNICTLATGAILIFCLVSVAEEAGLNLALSETPEDRFSRDSVHMILS